MVQHAIGIMDLYR